METTKKHDLKVIPRNILIIAKRRGYCIYKLSLMCNTDSGTLGRILKGQCDPSIKVLERVIEALHVTIEELTRVDGSELY